jgi:hypothetical protein
MTVSCDMGKITRFHAGRDSGSVPARYSRTDSHL